MINHLPRLALVVRHTTCMICFSSTPNSEGVHVATLAADGTTIHYVPAPADQRLSSTWERILVEVHSRVRGCPTCFKLEGSTVPTERIKDAIQRIREERALASAIVDLDGLMED